MAEPVESREEALRLAAGGALCGRALRGFDLRGCSLGAVLLDDTQWQQVGLVAAELDGSRLRGELRRVDARRSRWHGALWQQVSGSDCDLTEASGEGALLERVTLRATQAANWALGRAHLSRCQFEDVNLYGVKLRGAVVSRSRFSGRTELTRACLAGATLIDCDLRGVSLYRADLSGALLLRCQLQEALLDAALLDGAHFVGCDRG